MKIRTGVWVFLLSLVLFAAACDLWDLTDDETECTEAPTSCQDIRPSTGSMIVRCSMIPGRMTEVHVFRGDFELNEKLLDTLVEASFEIQDLPVDQYYSVVAVYVRANGDTIVAIDGDEIDVNSDEYCNGVECYEVDPARIDVLLKD